MVFPDDTEAGVVYDEFFVSTDHGAVNQPGRQRRQPPSPLLPGKDGTHTGGHPE